MCFESSQDDFICRRNTARGWGGLLTMAGSTKTGVDVGRSSDVSHYVAVWFVVL